MNIERCVEMLKNGGFRERHDAMNVMVKSDDIPMSEIEASLSASFERKDMGTFLCLTGVILSKGGSGVLGPYMGDPKVRNLVVSMVLRQAAGVYAAQKMKDKMQSENNKDNVPPYCHRPVDFSVEKEIEHALKEIGEHEDSIMSKEVKAKFSLKQPLVLFGKTFHETLKRIEVELTIAALMRSKKVFVIAGPSGSGKTMLLNSVLDRFRKTDSWVVKQCSRYLRSGENKNEKLSLYYVDDADTSRIHEAGDLMVLMNEQNNYLLVTCRDPEWPESFFGDFPRRTFNVPVPDWLDIENYLMERKVGSCFLSMESVKSSVKYLREFSPEPSFRIAADLWEELVANLMREDIMRGKKICSGAVSFTDEAVREAAEKDLLVRNNDDSDKEKNTKEIIISLEDIGRRIVGQDNVIDGVMPYLKSAVLGLSGKNRPAGVFFFYGPTGCGKSELGKVIADLLFQGRIQREDMNTYVDHHSIARIMGSPPGYLGCFSVSPFLTFLSENMNGVILLDEIEKSHPVV
ncbi:MAG TPA: AAA family ATPase, partial [Spirochaetota bacterium]|nr:AAA family ATPase [Spirochaetota bacterium]